MKAKGFLFLAVTLMSLTVFGANYEVAPGVSHDTEVKAFKHFDVVAVADYSADQNVTVALPVIAAGTKIVSFNVFVADFQRFGTSYHNVDYEATVVSDDSNNYLYPDEQEFVFKQNIYIHSGEPIPILS